MRILGIDPGASGALVILENDEPIEWCRMPTVQVGSATRVNAQALADFIDHECAHAYVEATHAMPGQGVVSMFNFGHSCGVVIGVLGALGIPYTMVQPQAWKKAAGLIGKDKDAARARAIELWPFWQDLWTKGRGQALADAALIARHG
jgi:crossover junction endodeoxyribonuclease RuvC